MTGYVDIFRGNNINSLADFVRYMPDEMIPLEKLRSGMIVCDTETGGLDKDEHPLLQVGMLVVDPKKPTEERKAINVLIKVTPEQFAACHPKALEVNGLTYERIEAEGVPIEEAEQMLIDFLSTPQLLASYKYVGTNPNFDLRFLKRYMPNLVKAFPAVFMNPDNVFDAQHLYGILLSKNPSPVPWMKKYKKAELMADNLGVEREPAVHDALEGARLVHRLMIRMIRILNDYDAILEQYNLGAG